MQAELKAARSVRFRRLVLVETIAALFAALLATLGFQRISGATWSDIHGTWGVNDAILEYAGAKFVQSMGLGLFNPDIGYPWGQDWTHFPALDPSNRIEMQLLNMLLAPVPAVNVMLILSFPLIAALMYAVLRNLLVHRMLAIFGGVSLSLVGYHFDYEHPFLGNYWIVPIGILWLSIITNAHSVLVQRSSIRVVTFVGIASGLAIGINNPQYAVFFCILGAFGLVLGRGISRQSLHFKHRLLVFISAPLALITVIAIGRMMRVIPAVSSTADRPVGDSYTWGGQPISLFTVPGDSFIAQVPINQSLLSALDTYFWTGVAASQNSAVVAASLVMAVSVLLLISGRFLRRGTWQEIFLPSRVWIALWLIGTVFFLNGGMGVVFAALISPQVRGWSRISVIIAALALAGALILISGILRHLRSLRSRGPRLVSIAIASALMILFLDVFTARFPVEADSSTLKELRNLSVGMEETLAEGCPVLNIPTTAFPEAVPLGSMQAYDHLLPYLADNPWKFSYGAIKGQLGSRWAGHLAVDPATQAAQASAEGFCAMLVDANGLNESTASLEQYFQELGPPSRSVANRWFLFTLSPTELATPQESLFSKPEVQYESGFAVEQLLDNGAVGRWTDQDQALIRVWNPGIGPTELLATMPISAPDCERTQEIIVNTSNGFRESITLRPGEQSDLVVPLAVPSKGFVDVSLETPFGLCEQSGEPVPVGLRLEELIFAVTTQSGVELVFSDGFHDPEVSPTGDSWRWMSNRNATVRILSTSANPALVSIRGQLLAPPCGQEQMISITDASSNDVLVGPVSLRAGQSIPLLIDINMLPFESKKLDVVSSQDGCLVDDDPRLLGPSVRDVSIRSIIASQAN